jgi:RNA-dependent RNA polymerase
LDGDEYGVIWDSQLFLDYNEPAFDYTPDKPKQTLPENKIMRRLMADFVINYITHDSVGVLATAHLVTSGFYGLQSKECGSLARKHMQALDFPKTGIVPDFLEKDTPEKDNLKGKLPIYPDFMEKNLKASYKSPGLNGKLFRYMLLDNCKKIWLF